MTTVSRHESEILRLVKVRGSCSILELAEKLGVSDETVRRHVKPLVAQGQVQKVHGGIIMPDRLREAPMERRMGENRQAKIAISEAVAEIVEDGDSLIMDTGSTTAYVALALSRRTNLKVITNSTEIARTLSRQPSNQVYMVGGELSADQLATFGPSALQFIRQFNVRHAILSIGGINEKNQLVNFALAEAEFSRAAIEQAASVTIAADHTKFSRKALVAAGEVDEIDWFVTDLSPPEGFQQALAENDVTLVVAG